MKSYSHNNTTSLSASPITGSRGRVWRIGLLFIAILMGLLLVFLGVFEYRDARRNGYRITEAQVLYMMIGFQRQLHHQRMPPAEIIENLYTGLAAEGVHQVAFFDGSRLLHQFGKGTKPLSPSDFPKMSLSKPVQIHFIQDDLVHARVVMPQRPPMGRGRRMRMMRNFSPNASPDEPGGAQRMVLLELTPRDAIRLRDRAFQIMLLDGVAALILMGAAIVFWKLSRRQDQLHQQLENDQQLKLLGQMSAVLGHELKNTIASVKGHAQLLEEKLAGTPNDANAALIAKDTLYLQKLTEQMLDFARTGTMHYEKVYLDDLAEAAITFCDAPDVKTHIAGNDPTFYLDRHKIQQVLINLINNAHQSGATAILLKITNSRTGLELRIEDNGKGIPAEALSRIFEPFFTTRAKGTGLGLALASRIVEAHGGTIVANSGENGTTFTIQLPPRERKDMP
jgi:two-component system, NtrC family, sensor histidine kinase HydH